LSSSSIVDWSSLPLLDPDDFLSIVVDSLFDDGLLSWLLSYGSIQLSDSLMAFSNILLDVFLAVNDNLMLDDLLLDDLLLGWSSLLVLLLEL